MKLTTLSGRRTSLVGSFLALVMLAGPREAVALSIDCGDDSEVYHEYPPIDGALSNIESPVGGARNVALNTRIWGGFHGGEVRIIGAEGQEVQVARHYLPLGGLTSAGDGIPILTPSEPLLPNSEYRVEAQFDPGYGKELKLLSWSFSTGERFADGAPPTPDVRVERTQFGVHLEIEFEGILVGEPEPSMGSFESFEDLLMPLGFEYGEWAREPGAPMFRWITQLPTLQLGDHACGWPLGKRTSARFGVFDFAGNFSGWTTIEDLDLPPEPGEPESSSLYFNYADNPSESSPRAAACSVGLGVGAEGRAGKAWRWSLLALAIGLVLAKRGRPQQEAW